MPSTSKLAGWWSCRSSRIRDPGGVGHAQPHFRAHAHRERARHDAHQRGHGEAPSGDRIEQGEQEEPGGEGGPGDLEFREDRDRDRERRDRHHGPEQPGGRDHVAFYFRGASIFSRRPFRMASVLLPSSSSSGEGMMRWRSAGSAIFFTSSGVTKSRPSSERRARAPRALAISRRAARRPPPRPPRRASRAPGGWRSRAPRRRR